MKKILCKLLDKYYNGKAYKNDSERAMPSLSESEIDELEQGKTIFEHYGGESSLYSDSEFIEKVNNKLEALNKMGFVTLKRDKNDPQLYERVYLNKDKVAEACAYAKYTRIDLIEENIMSILEKYKDSAFIGSVVRDMEETVKAHKVLNISKIDGKVDPDHLNQVLKAAEAIMSQKDEIYLRNLSIELFHDSKILEHILSHVYTVITKTSEEFDGLERKADVLNFFNVLKNPSYVFFKGFGSIVFANGTQYKLFGNSIGICSDILNDIDSITVDNETVMTIENLTTFNDIKCQNFMIYLGGYHNTARKNLLQKIYKTNKEKEYIHFGDIDAGGFYIFRRLKTDTGIPFTAYKMDIDTLERNKEYWKDLTVNDRKRLKCILDRDDMKEFREVITYMLKNNGKLEQEALYTE